MPDLTQYLWLAFQRGGWIPLGLCPAGCRHKPAYSQTASRVFTRPAPSSPGPGREPRRPRPLCRTCWETWSPTPTPSRRTPRSKWDTTATFAARISRSGTTSLATWTATTRSRASTAPTAPRSSHTKETSTNIKSSNVGLLPASNSTPCNFEDKMYIQAVTGLFKVKKKKRKWKRKRRKLLVRDGHISSVPAWWQGWKWCVRQLDVGSLCKGCVDSDVEPIVCLGTLCSIHEWNIYRG